MTTRVRGSGLLLVLAMILLLGACRPVSKTTEPSTLTSNVAGQVRTQCQAVSIAKSVLPAELASTLTSALCDADLARGPHGTWFVEFPVDNVTREELGWQSGPNVEFGPGNAYNLLDIEMDALTGEVTLKKATNGILLGGPDQWVNCGSTSQGHQEIGIVSVAGPLPPFNPGGPTVEITVKNVSTDAIVSLGATLRLNTTASFEFSVTSTDPLLPGETISVAQSMIGGSIDDLFHPLGVSGTRQDGSGFIYVVQVQVTLPQGQ